MRDGSTNAAAALSRQGRYTDISEHLRVKEVELETTPGRRWVVCHNTAEATRDTAARQEAITRLETELARIADARAKTEAAKKAATTDKARKRPRPSSPGTSAPSARYATTHPGRWLTEADRAAGDRPGQGRRRSPARRQVPAVHLRPAPARRDVALGYKNLLEAERGFRDLKSTLGLRPVFHRIEPRIRAHVLLAWLALLLDPPRRTTHRAHLGHHRPRDSRLHAVTLTGPAGAVVQATEPTDAQRAIYRACDATPPPRITSLHPH